MNVKMVQNIGLKCCRAPTQIFTGAPGPGLGAPYGSTLLNVFTCIGA